MATIEEWAEVLSVAAGPWKRDEMREFASEVLETLLIEVAESTLRTVRQELRNELKTCLIDGIDPAPLLRATAKVSRLSPEAIMTDATQKGVTLPRPERQKTVKA